MLSDGAAVSHSFTRDGSYIVFALENGGSVIYAEAERTAYLWPAIGGGAAVIAAAGAYLLLRRKKKTARPRGKRRAGRISKIPHMTMPLRMKIRRGNSFKC